LELCAEYLNVLISICIHVVVIFVCVSIFNSCIGLDLFLFLSIAGLFTLVLRFVISAIYKHSLTGVQIKHAGLLPHNFDRH
jgi:hypothetical protein